MDHPFVADYLRRLDRAASEVPPARRRVLQDEIAAHLRHVVPPEATDEHAAQTIEAFGSPEHLVTEAFGESAAAGPRSRQRVAPTGALVTTLALAVAGMAGLALNADRGGEPRTGSPSPQQAAGDDVPGNVPTVTSVVNADPKGADRVTQGRTFAEYQAAIASMPHPLPPGAEYPLGVPAGMEPGITAEAAVETGRGTNTAYFTWLCAWESEYLAAVEAEDFDRVIVAEEMIVAWMDMPVHQEPDEPLTGWEGSVVEPMRFGDPSGVRADRPATCMHAGIYNVGS